MEEVTTRIARAGTRKEEKVVEHVLQMKVEEKHCLAVALHYHYFH